MTPDHTRGFTLIELSIILVIIGLIAGGVLVGRDMIRQSELRRLAREPEILQTAINTFKLKYNCLPGDCATATQFFGSGSPCNQGSAVASGACNGDGDGRVSLTHTIGERLWIFHHLMLAGLYVPITNPGQKAPDCGNAVTTVRPGYNIPEILPSTGIMAFHMLVSSTYEGSGYANREYVANFAGDIMTLGKATPCASGGSNWGGDGYGVPNSLSVAEMYALDAKFDNGFPHTGRIGTGWDLMSGGCFTGSLGSTVYNTSNAGPNACAVMVKIGR